MKPHPRIRKTVKCGGAAVSVVVVFATIMLFTDDVGWSESRGEFMIGARQRAPWCVLSAMVLLPTAAAWHLDALARRRRAGLNLCPKCDYDRTGLATNAVCPECGTAS